MANTKISALTSATTPLAGTEVLPIVQSGATVKVANNDLRPKQIQSNATSGVLQITGPAAASTRVVTIPDANWTAARTDAAQSFTGTQTVSTGNIVASTGDINITLGALNVSAGNVVIGTSGKGIDFSATSGSGTSELLADYEEGTWTPTQGAGLTVIGAFTSNGTYTKVGRLVTIRGKVDGATSVACSSAGIICGGLPYAVATDTAGVYFNGTLSAGGSVDANSSNVNAVGAIGATVSIYFSATYQV
jgi:hypothetical protein